LKILITGGAGNGKSLYAESLMLAGPSPRHYIAAMIPFGDEAKARVARHQAMRAGKGFITHERYTDIDTLILEPNGTILLECLCNLTANEMFTADGAERDTDAVYQKILRGVDALSSQCARLILITNEVACDTGSYAESTLRYARLLAGINLTLTAAADTVYEMVCGIPLAIKEAKV
jgi:adenosylcobinamide kinase/adenosylcobinamide-phosphate guanylyltransferase